MDLKEKKELLIQNLILQGYLKTPEIIKTSKQVPREAFIPEKYKNYAYADEPLPIGYGQTISAPHMVAIMTELLQPEKTDKVLEIGCGSGYQAAILSGLCKKVYTVELEKNLAESAKKILEALGYRNVEVILGDGSFGCKKAAPYDKIMVTCGAPEIPEELINQLKNNGKIVIPVGGQWYQELIVATKKRGRLQQENHGGCVFVPMRH